MLELLLQSINAVPGLITEVIAAMSRNPAAALALPDRGILAPGRAADLLLVDPAAGTLKAVMCRGVWLLRDGDMCSATRTG